MCGKVEKCVKNVKNMKKKMCEKREKKKLDFKLPLKKNKIFFLLKNIEILVTYSIINRNFSSKFIFSKLSSSSSSASYSEFCY